VILHLSTTPEKYHHTTSWNAAHCFCDQNYIVFPLKSGLLWKQSVVMLYRNLNFGKALSLKMLKITIVCTDTLCQPFLTLIYPIIHHAVLAFRRYLNKSLMHLVQLFCCLAVTGMYTGPLCEFLREQNKQFFISERTKSILCFANLSIFLQLRMLKTNYCCKMTFRTFQSTVATFYRCGGQKQKHLCQISSGFCIPKIIKICPFLTELFKKH